MDFSQEILKMAGSLLVVLALLLGGLAWVRKLFGEVGGPGGVPVMRVLGGLRLGSGKHLMLVEVAGEVLVLGATARELTLLTRIDDEERITRLRMATHPVAIKLNTWFGPVRSKKSTSSEHAGFRKPFQEHSSG
jgi:flagellar biogenesis protein FliO